MSEKFNDVFRDYFRAHLEPADIRVGQVVGTQFPVTLSLALPTGARLKSALVVPPQGAILALDMTMETAVHLRDEISAFLDAATGKRQL